MDKIIPVGTDIEFYTLPNGWEDGVVNGYIHLAGDICAYRIAIKTNHQFSRPFENVRLPYVVPVDELVSL